MQGYHKFKECHKGTIQVFVDPISKIKFKGGGLIRDMELKSNETALCLMNNYSNKFEV